MGSKGVKKGGRHKQPKAGANRLVRESKPQGFANGEIHNWYNFVLGFSDKLVAQMMTRLSVRPGQVVLDPFCGTGTTLVESMKLGVASIGIDASPFSCFVSRVKTNYDLDPNRLISSLVNVGIAYRELRHSNFDVKRDDTYKYLLESGMIRRGWISARPLSDALTLKAAILQAAPSAKYRDALLLALVAKLSKEIGNMKFGPEIYRGHRKRSVDVWKVFERQVSLMVQDLCRTGNGKLKRARIIQGDARDCSTLLRRRGIRRVHVAIFKAVH